jgi:hypothetical protein
MKLIWLKKPSWAQDLLLPGAEVVLGRGMSFDADKASFIPADSLLGYGRRDRTGERLFDDAQDSCAHERQVEVEMQTGGGLLLTARAESKVRVVLAREGDPTVLLLAKGAPPVLLPLGARFWLLDGWDESGFEIAEGPLERFRASEAERGAPLLAGFKPEARELDRRLRAALLVRGSVRINADTLAQAALDVDGWVSAAPTRTWRHEYTAFLTGRARALTEQIAVPPSMQLAALFAPGQHAQLELLERKVLELGGACRGRTQGVFVALPNEVLTHILSFFLRPEQRGEVRGHRVLERSLWPAAKSCSRLLLAAANTVAFRRLNSNAWRKTVSRFMQCVASFIGERGDRTVRAVQFANRARRAARPPLLQLPPPVLELVMRYAGLGDIKCGREPITSNGIVMLASACTWTHCAIASALIDARVLSYDVREEPEPTRRPCDLTPNSLLCGGISQWCPGTMVLSSPWMTGFDSRTFPDWETEQDEFPDLDSVFAASLRHFQIVSLTLNLKNWQQATEKTLSAVLALGDFLQHLEIQGEGEDFSITAEDLAPLFSGRAFPSLRVFRMGDNRLFETSGMNDDAVMDSMWSSIENAEVLDLGGLELFCGTFHEGFWGMENLRHIVLSAMDDLEDSNIFDITRVTQGTLEILELSCCIQLTDMCFRRFALCEKLRKLDISYNHKFTSLGASVLVSGCAPTQDERYHSHCVYDEAHQPSAGCKLLECLDISCCPGIDEADIARSCPGVQVLRKQPTSIMSRFAAATGSDPDPGIYAFEWRDNRRWGEQEWRLSDIPACWYTGSGIPEGIMCDTQPTSTSSSACEPFDF